MFVLSAVLQLVRGLMLFTHHSVDSQPEQTTSSKANTVTPGRSLETSENNDGGCAC